MTPSIFGRNPFSQVHPYQIPSGAALPALSGGGLKPLSNVLRPESISTQAGSMQPSVDPVLDAIASLTDQMKSMSAVLKDVHDLSNRHSATLRNHASSIHMISNETKNHSVYPDPDTMGSWVGPSQASTRETTPHTMPSFAPGRIASSIQGNPIGVPQPYRYAVSPSIQSEEPASKPPVPTLAAVSPRSPNTTARSIRSTRPRRPSMAEAANIRSTSHSSRSVAAASRGRLVNQPQLQQKPTPIARPVRPPVGAISNRLNIPTIASENRAKSPARVSRAQILTQQPIDNTRAKSPARVSGGLSHRQKSPGRIGGAASPQSFPLAEPIHTEAAKQPPTPLMRYELQISYNEHIVAKSQIKPAISEDGPFLYVIQSELNPSLSFIPHPEMPCSFTGLSISVVATNTRTRNSNAIFQSHGSHVDNPPVNETDGYFSHSCWLSGPSASVVGGVRMFFRRDDSDQVTLFAMSLKFWFPESVGNGLAQAPHFTKDHFKELLRLLGLLSN